MQCFYYSNVQQEKIGLWYKATALDIHVRCRVIWKGGNYRGGRENRGEEIER